MGARNQDVLLPREQVSQLACYGDEMDRFTRFLRNVYWALPDV